MIEPTDAAISEALARIERIDLLEHPRIIARQRIHDYRQKPQIKRMTQIKKNLIIIISYLRYLCHLRLKLLAAHGRYDLILKNRINCCCTLG